MSFFLTIFKKKSAEMIASQHFEKESHHNTTLLLRQFYSYKDLLAMFFKCFSLQYRDKIMIISHVKKYITFKKRFVKKKGEIVVVGKLFA